MGDIDEDNEDMDPTNSKVPITGDILIVDDVPANLRLLSGMLVEQGYTVRLARNGKLALMGAKTSLPDLILLDINLPDLSGFEVCAQLNADPKTREIPIIFISARDQTRDKVRALTTGGVDYITKPLQLEEVLARVATHLTLHRLQRQLAEEKQRAETAHAMVGTVLNNLDALIYVADLETYDVLFANAKLKEVFGEIEGCTCWQALQEGLEEPCSFCSNPDLLDEGGQPTGIVRWQFQNTRNGRWYTVADSAIHWIDGRLVRLSMAADITEHKDAEKRLLAQQRLVAALDERERIGRDLHDDLGQVMGYVNAQTQAALEFLDQGQADQTRAVLRQLVDVAQEAHADVRQYILGVRTPASRQPFDFLTALKHYLEQMEQRHGLSVNVNWPEALRDSPLARNVETQLLRIIQEALTNVRKHAEVDAARLIFILHTEEIQVVISDEGQGFDPSSIEHPAPTPHFGLTIMRERAEKMGGQLEVYTEPGRGTQILVRLPRTLAPHEGETLQDLRVLLVDDHDLYLKGLRNLLSARGIHVVGLAHDGVEAQALARRHRPDLILMDVEMPRCDGIEATRRIKAALPETRIVILTVAADDETLFEALKSGADGYLLKDLESRQFFDLLRNVLQGDNVLSPSLAARTLKSLAADEGSEADDPTPPLTTRQREVLELVAQGMTNREIAQALHISPDTVKYHVSHILERLHVQSRYELAGYTLDPPDHQDA